MSDTIRVLMHAESYGIEIHGARKANEKEQAEYADWAKNRIHFATKDSQIDLEYISWRDFDALGIKDSIGFFPGCNNQIYAITPEQEDKIVALNHSRAVAAKAKEKAEQIEEYQRIVDEGDAIMKRTGEPLMNCEQAAAWCKEFNDINNEGGEGFVPSVLTLESYNHAKNILNNN